MSAAPDAVRSLPGVAIGLALRCASRELRLAMALRLGAVVALLAAIQIFVEFVARPADRPWLLVVGLGFGALLLSGLGLQFGRRRKGCDPWLRSLPRPSGWWLACDVLALDLIGAALVAPLAVGALITHDVPALTLVVLLLSYSVLLTALAALACALPETSFAWSVLMLVAWVAATIAILPTGVA